MYEIKFIAEVIKQARLSQRKQRNLPGNPPNVGVVIVSDKGKVLAKAYRSEGKIGRHAEFVALECKLSNIDLRGTTLYTTLEPCMDVRCEEKIDCAKRIVNRGVSEVIIGMLDPDIRVSAKGLLYLHENNVKVRLFPKEFEEEIKMINKQFSKSKTVTSTDEPQLSKAKGKQSHIFCFIDDLKPDPVAILSYADLLKKRRTITPSIRWSTTAIKLWERAIEERTLIIQELRLAHVLYGKSNKPPFNVDWLKHFTNVIEEVDHVRRNAAFRIPKIWKGMKPFWSSILLLQHAFQPALTNYLTLCNAHIISALFHLQRIVDPPFPRGKINHIVTKPAVKGRKKKATRAVLFPQAYNWIRYPAGKAEMYRDIFGYDKPFHIVTISRIGDTLVDYDLYGPQEQIHQMWISKGVRLSPNELGLYNEFLIPQIEYRLIGEKKVVSYGTIQGRRILNEEWKEVRQFL